MYAEDNIPERLVATSSRGWTANCIALRQLKELFLRKLPASPALTMPRQSNTIRKRVQRPSTFGFYVLHHELSLGAAVHRRLRPEKTACFWQL